MGPKVAAVVFSLGCLQTSSALALGLGQLELDSNLNEPLQASVDLLNLGDLHHDEIKVRLGTREDFKRLGIDRPFFLTGIQFDVVVGEDGRGRIVMSTEDAVQEPYLNFVVEARWPTGRLLREYTVLMDPPAFADSTAVTVSATERVSEVEGLPAKKKAESGADGASRVDLRKSDLGPGEMPARDFNAAADRTPAPGARYMVARDDTLWRIAMQAKPEGASVHQTMLDIQRLNPDAFINNNINRVKAGYIIYLPSAEDISSEDLSSALAEVREQNAAWREGRDASLAAAGARPTLRISAREDDAGDTLTSGSGTGGAAADGAADDGAAAVGGVASDRDGTADGAGQRLQGMEERLATLQRIVDVKDEQIAALQAALAEARAAGAQTAADAPAADAEAESLEAEATGMVAGGAEDADTAAAMPNAGAAGAGASDVDARERAGAPAIAAQDGPAAGEASGEAAAEEAAQDEERAAAPAPAPRTASSPVTAQGGGLLDYLWYAVGAAVFAVLGIFLYRRRGAEEGEPAASSAAGEDVFSNVRLQGGDLAVEQGVPAGAPTTEAAPLAEEPLPPERASRGYGERRHDGYAADVEAADALAEADIYIAYGRHPQAIALIDNALANEPDNALYHLKLLEIHTELNDRVAAMKSFEQVRRVGDGDMIARAEDLLAGLDAGERDPSPDVADEPEPVQRRVDEGPGLPPNPLDLVDDQEGGETEFSGLEIEPEGEAAEEDLDLSPDFQRDDDDDEELVIAADSNGLSTKLDLARAYIDMGDEDGARQILEEIVAEGGDELQAEARALLDRIG